jgi:cytochrome c biogenesis protein CcmG, thiol:disulfide interchange protein DsbE
MDETPRDGTGGGAEAGAGAEKRWWKRLPKWADRALWVLVLGLLVYRFGPQVGAAVGVGGENRPAPDFALQTLTGDTVTLASLEGKVVLLNFWATWCPPCRVEMPWFEKLARERAAEGFVVVGASMDRGAPDVLRWFVEEKSITYPVGVAPNRMARDYGGVRGLPTSFLIDRQGRVRHTVTGIFAEPALRAAVDRLLAEE